MEERFTEIERENRILLEKMTQIMNSKHPFSLKTQRKQQPLLIQFSVSSEAWDEKLKQAKPQGELIENHNRELVDPQEVIREGELLQRCRLGRRLQEEREDTQENV